MNGPMMCRPGSRRSYGTHTGSSARKITTGTVVPKYALRETTVLAITPATQRGRSPACQAGRENTAKNQSALRDAAQGTEIVHSQESAYAEKAGRVLHVMSVNVTRPANMALVGSPGSALARRAGEASSVTKI